MYDPFDVRISVSKKRQVWKGVSGPPGPSPWIRHCKDVREQSRLDYIPLYFISSQHISTRYIYIYIYIYIYVTFIPLYLKGEVLLNIAISIPAIFSIVSKLRHKENPWSPLYFSGKGAVYASYFRKTMFPSLFICTHFIYNGLFHIKRRIASFFCCLTFFGRRLRPHDALRQPLIEKFNW